MYNIFSFTISRLNNAEITGFFLNVQKAVTEQNADTCGFDATVWSNYREKLKLLVDQVYVSQASELTSKMNIYDDKRVAIFRRLRLRLQMVNYSEDDTMLNAIKEVVLIEILGRYTGDIGQMAVQQKTAVLEGFTHDCRTKLTERQQDDMGLSDDLDALEAANAAFMTAYNERCVQRSQNEGSLTANLRNSLTELYQLLAIQALYHANDSSTVEADVTKATACQAFVGVLNELLKDAKARLDQRQGRESKSNSSNSGTSNTDKPAASDDKPAASDDKPAASDDKPADSGERTIVRVTENADGSTTTYYSDGSYVIEDEDGNKTEYKG